MEAQKEVPFKRRRTHEKYVLLLLVAMFLTFVLVACRGTPAPTITPTLTPSVEKVTPQVTIAQTLALAQRKEIYLVFKVALATAGLAIIESKPYRPPDRLSFATAMVVGGYGIDTNSLGSILLEGEERDWDTLIPRLELAIFAWEFLDRRQRLPDLAEIKDFWIGRDIAEKTVKDLARIMAKDYAGIEFERAGISLALRSSDFSPSEVAQVVDAYIKTLEGDYLHFGDPWLTGGYYRSAHERFQVILKGHESAVREILEDRLITGKAPVAAIAAKLLIFYGNQNSIAKLKTAKERFIADEIYQIFVDVAVSLLVEHGALR